MIRFSAFLVVVAVGLLAAGVVTSKLLLVYIAIGVSGVALLALGVGAAVNWSELTGKPNTAAAETSAQGPVPQPQAPAPQAVPALAAAQPKPPATAAAAAGGAGPGWPAAAPSAPSRAGYLPTEQPLRAQPPWASPSAFQPASAPSTFTARPQAPPPPAPPQPAAEPISPPGEDAAEPPLPPEPKQPPPTTPSPEKDPSPAEGQIAAYQPSPQDQPPADRRGDAEPAVTAAAEAPASPQADQAGPANKAEPAEPDPNLEVTVVPGVPRYHNAQCILIRFMGEKDLEKTTLSAAREVGCTPCRACLPDQPERALQ